MTLKFCDKKEMRCLRIDCDEPSELIGKIEKAVKKICEFKIVQVVTSPCFTQAVIIYQRSIF